MLGIERVEAAQVRTTALHRMETEDYASALVRLGNGAPGTIIATVAAWPGSPEWLAHHRREGHGAAGGRRICVCAFVDGGEEVLEDAGGSGSGASVMSFSHEAHKCGHQRLPRRDRAATRAGDSRGGGAGDAASDRGDSGTWEGVNMQDLLPLAEKLGARLKARGDTIAIAESSTGGLISAALLSVAGASAYFRGGSVIYTHYARAGFLDIPNPLPNGIACFVRTLCGAARDDGAEPARLDMGAGRDRCDRTDGQSLWRCRRPHLHRA